MFDVITNPDFWMLVGAYWMFNAAVGAMPEPKANGSLGYQFLYKFAHTLAGNVTTAFGSKIPGNTTLKP